MYRAEEPGAQNPKRFFWLPAPGFLYSLAILNDLFSALREQPEEPGAIVQKE